MKIDFILDAMYLVVFTVCLVIEKRRKTPSFSYGDISRKP